MPSVPHAVASAAGAMHEETEPVRLEGKRLRRCLHVVRARDAPYLGGEPLLVLVRVEMLDRRVREADVERAVVVLQVAAVARNPLEVRRRSSVRWGTVTFRSTMRDGTSTNRQFVSVPPTSRMLDTPVGANSSTNASIRRRRKRSVMRNSRCRSRAFTGWPDPTWPSSAPRLPSAHPRRLEIEPDIFRLGPAPCSGPLHEEAMDDRAGHSRPVSDSSAPCARSSRRRSLEPRRAARSRGTAPRPPPLSRCDRRACPTHDLQR